MHQKPFLMFIFFFLIARQKEKTNQKSESEQRAKGQALPARSPFNASIQDKKNMPESLFASLSGSRSKLASLFPLTRYSQGSALKPLAAVGG